MCRHPICCIIPDHLLRRIAENGDADERRIALQTLATSTTMRSARTQAEGRRSVTPRAPESGIMSLGPPEKDRIIRNAANEEDLRGTIVRTEDRNDMPDDPAVNEAFDSLGDTWDFYFETFARNSIDKAGMALNASVHYRDHFNNAQWNSNQMVFGDGNGLKFTRLTKSLTVCAHELTHGVIQYDGPLIYQSESGALNESMADVLGSLVEQWKLKQTPDEAYWIIGREILGSGVEGVGLRSLEDPGSAHDDRVLGKDAQPKHTDGFVRTDEDYGGVHINSGIPNHAFYRLATALGKPAWEDAGRIWYNALGHERLLPASTFRQFARVTRYVAGVLFGPDSDPAKAVVAAWRGVGVEL